ncbi:2-dehydropantoate 2-reductase N-terminal domain-containing protein [Streptomyces sp. LHD-70]|uniref:ketopantoate reductase family protein n=1 Tax=Streptomyces sp. LHD-70 TaxID=3072140 RepID=UPI00280FF8C8|nr:2-dehydropantoate 2-reductase N-terminal domain-containing protein [Streptomyces sp. LHD-70]MDQ8701549.1 2-dehydropantoate 2-reductase N-terminal domain-containing protein [Streptomyces sp. LHD-70]
MTTTPASHTPSTPNSTPWTIAVLGPGGVGGLVAGLLARDGHRVICLAREETAAVLAERGVTVRSGTFGDFTARVEADTELREPVDALIVAPKETGLRSALERVPREALGAGLAVPLLNGFEHVDVLRGRYPAEQVVPGTIRVESTRVGPGVIEHGGLNARIELASSTAPHARVEAFAEVLRGAGQQVDVLADETAMLWGKLSFLLPMALLSTRYGVPVGEVRTVHRDRMLAVIGEFAEVAAAQGAPLDVPAPRVVHGIALRARPHTPDGLELILKRRRGYPSARPAFEDERLSAIRGPGQSPGTGSRGPTEPDAPPTARTP